METRINLLKLLEKKEPLLREYRENYEGPNLFKRFKRLFKYRERFLKHCFSKLKPFFIKTKTFWGVDFLTFLPEGFICYSFGLLGGPEIKLIKFLIKNIDDNSVFYDIGANIGYYGLLVKEISDSIEVHSFEPVPKTFEYLKKNLQNKQNIFLNQLAISNKDGKIDFYNITEEGSGRSTLNSSIAKLLPNFQKIKVKAITLDKYCVNYSKPTFIKIDVEGAESQAIEGGIKTLKEGSPIIAMEVWKKAPNNASHLKAIEILYNLNYKSYKINNEGELEFIEKIDPERDILEKDESDNFIFKKL